MTRKPAVATTVTEQQVRRYAVSVCEEHRDENYEVNLTALGEDVFVHFNFTEAQYESMDVDFVIYAELKHMQLL